MLRKMLGWGGGDVNVPCTCTMFLASQQDVFGQSARCFWPVNGMFLASQQGPVTSLVGQVGVFGKSPGCSWTVGQFLAGLGLHHDLDQLCFFASV